MIPAALASAAVALVPGIVESVIKAIGQAHASEEQRRAAEAAARAYIRSMQQPADTTLAGDYNAALEAAMESPPMTLADSDVEDDDTPSGASGR